MLTEYAHILCAKMCIDVSSFSSVLYGEKHATNRRQKNEISKDEKFVPETRQVSRHLLINNILYDRTITCMMNSAIAAIKKSRWI